MRSILAFKPNSLSLRSYIVVLVVFASNTWQKHRLEALEVLPCKSVPKLPNNQVLDKPQTQLSNISTKVSCVESLASTKHFQLATSDNSLLAHHLNRSINKKHNALHKLLDLQKYRLISGRMRLISRFEILPPPCELFTLCR